MQRTSAHFMLNMPYHVQKLYFLFFTEHTFYCKLNKY